MDSLDGIKVNSDFRYFHIHYLSDLQLFVLACIFVLYPLAVYNLSVGNSALLNYVGDIFTKKGNENEDA